ncbi:MAG: TonB-dependent receptor [Chitinophaga sp.]|uniref:TonB-dependent receptor n=1 Tax=Chitinophaga sp. TaxID=1869181 RepID=UPI0025B872ED|nr:TonB-dependent receptor [Chitinophaga sp.]MBV8253662.1 TonB-dependent receptor [Chitinophaga sp.]
MKRTTQLKKTILTICLALSSLIVLAQKGQLSGIVRDTDGGAVKSATISIPKLNIGITTDSSGQYQINNIPVGTHKVIVYAIGYDKRGESIVIKENEKMVMDFSLTSLSSALNEVVVTGTKTFKRKTESPVIVNILDSKTLGNLQVCNLSEGLKFQPGLRVETDCQTCNYTQLRMNGLQGGYSQILINGRPIFSPLMGLYGMEQLPVNMIEKIEVVRGGGSSLYGSSAIGGTVNVITKLPKKSGYEINSFYQNIGGKTNDFNFGGNATLVNEEGNAGTSFFINKRDRGYYDASGDNFSEIPKIENTSMGVNSFYKFTDNQKLEVSLSNLNEYRFGGEMVNKPAYLTQQSEERTHKIWMGSADYQINFNQNKSSFIIYSAFQNTNRKHYTGVFPDDPEDIQQHLENPPYGTSKTTTLQGGLQLNHEISNFLNHRNVLTIGSEYVSDKVFDNIPSYNYLVDQHTKDWGTFFQSDWDFADKFNLLSGLRMDKHNLLDKVILSPRVALLYKYNSNAQFRVSYGTGFRAPQAFDTDLHIAFAGGGVSRVQLSPDLKEERSQSVSTSFNYDKAAEKWIAGFTLEGFYTHLKNAFVLERVGQDDFGAVFEKRNGRSATVKGFTLELRANYNKKMQLETGFTLQNSEYGNPIAYIKGIEPTKAFLKTPNDYGFANLSITPNQKWAINLNYVYTGKMHMTHWGGADNFPDDQMVTTPAFSEVNSKVSHTFHLPKFKHDLEIYTGVKNIFNAYQSDFDQGKNRDSNYIYGPGIPRTFFVGIKIKTD